MQPNELSLVLFVLKDQRDKIRQREVALKAAEQTITKLRQLVKSQEKTIEELLDATRNP